MENKVKILTDNIYDIIANNGNDLIFSSGVNMWLVDNNMIFIEDNSTERIFKIKIEEVPEVEE